MRNDIRKWFEEGKQRGATHLAIIWDEMTMANTPVFVLPGQNPRVIVNTQRQLGCTYVLMEVYKLSLPLEGQLAERRAMHY